MPYPSVLTFEPGTDQFKLNITHEHQACQNLCELATIFRDGESREPPYVVFKWNASRVVVAYQ